MNHYIFFDTETTGLPLNWKAPMRNTNNWPRVIQLAWARFNDAGELVDKNCQLITPDGWEIPKEQFWIENGYSTEKNAAEGIGIFQALQDFESAMMDCHTLVSHNMSYDYNVAGAEMIRLNMAWPPHLRQVCTKDESTNYCKLPGQYGKYKWPKLSELHVKLFGSGFDNAHDAMADVEALARCFFKMRELNLIPSTAKSYANL